MSNRILDVTVEDRSLDPMSAELWLSVRLDAVTPTTEIRGRLMGPSCPYASTVEIAYPLLPLVRGEPLPAGTLRFRVVIPEASLWDPQSPFLYAGPLELWQDGQRQDRLWLRHGLRRVTLGPQGFRINTRILSLSGEAVESLDEASARELRSRGCNLLLVPVRASTVPVWDVADQFGFLVLGRCDDMEAEETPALARHACCLGWVFSAEDAARGQLLSESGFFVGTESPDAVPSGYHFQVRHEGDRCSLWAGTVELGHISGLSRLTS